MQSKARFMVAPRTVPHPARIVSKFTTFVAARQIDIYPLRRFPGHCCKAATKNETKSPMQQPKPGARGRTQIDASGRWQNYYRHPATAISPWKFR
jgi:hypothetical protein